MTDFAQRVLSVALTGERNRGNGGIVLCNRSTDKIAYILVHEIESEELRETVGDLLTEEGLRYFFILEEKDRKIHIWKVDKTAGNTRSE